MQKLNIGDKVITLVDIYNCNKGTIGTVTQVNDFYYKIYFINKWNKKDFWHVSHDFALRGVEGKDIPNWIKPLEKEEINNIKHPQAELMMQYAQDAMETDKPWERWEQGYYKEGKEHDYQPCTSNPTWKVEWCYRRKPKTININGFEVPEPLKHLDFTKDFPVGLACVNLLSQNNFYSLIYEGHGINEVKDKLEKGLLHLTKEAAELHAKALLSFTKKEECS